MRFTNLTRHNEIGANSYYVEGNGPRYLLDCGTHPKIDGKESLPRFDFLSGKSIDAVLVTHGHLDHIGSLPVVMADHPEATAYLTPATAMIAERALHNSASVMIKQRAELHLPEYPFFTHGEVDRMADDLNAVGYGRPIHLNGDTVTFHEAGHVQGAAGIWIQSGNHSLFYTGDAKFSDMRITRGARFPEKAPDTLVIECTRGSTPAIAGFTWDNEISRLAAAIRETFERGGSVLIPCFALGKTQEILKVFHDLMREGLLPKQPVFISGLGSSYNEIYDDLAAHHPRVCPGFKIEKSLDLVVLERKEAMKMNLGKGRLMLVSSGMMTPHTMSHAMTLRMAADPRHSIFFVGYVDPDSPAGHLKAAGQGGRADLAGDIGEIDVKCHINSFDFTSHCNREHMLDYVLKIRPRQVVLVHGDPSSLAWFQQQLNQQMPDSKIIIPPSGETINLD